MDVPYVLNPIAGHVVFFFFLLIFPILNNAEMNILVFAPLCICLLISLWQNPKSGIARGHAYFKVFDT